MVQAASDHDALYRELLPLLRDPSGMAEGPARPYRPGGRVWSFCPIHEADGSHRRRSLSLHPRIGVTCFAQCDFRAIVEALRGAAPRPAAPRGQVVRFPTPAASRPAPKPAREALGAPTQEYDYRDDGGVLRGYKARWDRPDGTKTFRWRLPDSDPQTGYTLGLKPAGLTTADMPLWRSERVAAEADPRRWIWFVEGEKCVQACEARQLLATCGPGSASQRDFGAALEVLRGRRVRVVPDNDAPGQEFATHLLPQLKALCAEVQVVRLPVSEGEDIADFFGRGGTVEEIERLLQGEIAEPQVAYLSHDALRVLMPSPLGTLAFTFTEMEKSSRALEAELDLALVGPGRRSDDSYTTRLNLLSNSARTELRRDLQELYGKLEGQWPRVLNRAVALARQAFQAMDRGLDVADIAVEAEQRFHVETLLPDGEPTIIFGNGSSGKSYLVFALALHAALGLPFCGLATTPGPWLVVDYETNPSGANFARRLRRLAQGLGFAELPPGLLHYWPARGVPLPDMAEAIRRKCDRDGIRGIVVDSAVPACGGDPIDAAVVGRFFGALAKIARTSVIVGHQNRGGDEHFPFGSIFWHNEARRTWNVQRAQEIGSSSADVLLSCRKVNDGPLPRPLALRLAFADPDGPVTVGPQRGQLALELADKLPSKLRIRDFLLANGATSAFDIASSLGLPGETVSKTLRRNPHLFTPVERGGRGPGDMSRWGVADAT